MIMTHFGRRWSIVSLLVIVAWLLVSLLQSHDAFAESKKVSGTRKVVTELARSGLDITLGDASYFVGFLTNRLWVYSSTDPAWNNATAYSVVFSEQAIRAFKGFIVVTHPGGDQTFLEIEGTWEETGFPKGQVGGYAGQWEGRFLGGTGTFKGIRGRLTATWKLSTKGVTGEWEAEYEIQP
jgi:hypothetical protein